jgi:hypothetical protein
MEEAKIIKGPDGKLQLENFYAPLEEAKVEIWRRWNDKELRKKVEEFLGGDVPESMKKKPRACLGRNIISPDIEFFHFLDLVKKIQLEPLGFEYLDDKFVAANSDKYHIGKFFFYSGKGKNSGNKIDVLKIIDFPKAEGKRFGNIKTIWGENFIDFHHRILDYALPGFTKEVFDASAWIRRKKSFERFYSSYLTLHICFGVLFETYLLDEDEIEFTEKIAVPTFNKIYKIFGMKPLVVRLIPSGEESNLYWWCYPASIKKLLRMMVVI